MNNRFYITFSTLLTCLRMLLAPCVMFAIWQNSWYAAFIFFSCAAFTDFLDGYYARLYQQETQLGKMLDPIADKILLFFTFFALYGHADQAIVPLWFVVLLASKDLLLLVVGGLLLARNKFVFIGPSMLAKVTTAVCMFFVLYVMLVHASYLSADYVSVLIYFLSISTVIIVLDYSYRLYQQW